MPLNEASLIIALIIFLILSWIYIINLFNENVSLKEQIRETNKWKSNAKMTIRELDVCLRDLYRTKEDMKRIIYSTLEAVNFARKKAHPDNGGNVEDFQKYQELYSDLTEKLLILKAKEKLHK